MYRQIIDKLPGLSFGSRVIVTHDVGREASFVMNAARRNAAEAMVQEIMKDQRFFSFQEIRYGSVFAEVRVDAIVMTAEELRNIMMDYYEKGMQARRSEFGYVPSPS